MKYWNKIKLLVVFFVTFSTIQGFSNQKKMVIGAVGTGFFVDFFGVLHHLMLCEQGNFIPVVYWDENSKYSDPNAKNANTWEYYFEPVSDITYEEGDPISREYWVKNVYCINGGNYLNHRFIIHNLIKKYIRIKPEVQEKINSFFKEKMAGKRTIGIHLRGTDRYLCVKPTPLSTIINEANKYASKDTQFFIASDDINLFAEAVRTLNGPVISYDSFRSNSTVNEWWQFESDRRKLGEDVLIDAQLLSLCDHLICTQSSVSNAALFFNPTMSYTLFSPE